MLRGQELLIDAAHLPETPPDEPYLHDILGLPVLLAATGDPVGVLEDVLFPAGQEVWSIRAPEGHEILFPAVPEFVDDIDPEGGRILITPPEGLLPRRRRDRSIRPAVGRRPRQTSALRSGRARQTPLDRAPLSDPSPRQDRRIPCARPVFPGTLP